MDMDFSEMDHEELFYRVEVLLKQKGFHSVSETWEETARRIKDQDPEMAELLFKAQQRWDELH
ncbi:MAG: hypothetical protein JRI97_07800 [Deltaproteobacteria bacterium]|nr:hypothetical protein [Deltaproteobacteria bacterium]